MKLAKLEQVAREKQAERVKLAAQKELVEQAVCEAAVENFKQRVVAWMVAESHLHYEELWDTLTIADLGRMKVQLSVPEHGIIDFRLQERDGALQVKDGRFVIGSGRYAAHSLGDALAKAGDLWYEDQDDDWFQAQRQEQREARRAAAKQEAEERGQHYLDMLDSYPILRPILDILAIYAEDRERFEADIEAADEFAAGVEAGLGAKLEQATHDADSHARERDGLQRDLYSARDELAKAERREKRGW